MFISQKDKVFVAGGNGMVGSGIIRKLRNKGYSKILAPNRKDLNLSQKEEVISWFKKNKPNVVIVAAAKVGGIYANNNYPVDFILENLKIQTNIIEASFEFKIKRLLFLGSSCIYPKYAAQPIREEELLNGPLEPTNEWYAIAKIAGIKLCEAYRKQYGFDTFSLMPTNLYGPGDNYHIKDSHVIPGLIRRFYEAEKSNAKEVICWGTGKPKREFLHVDDLSEACIFALEYWNPSDYETFKSNSNSPISFLNVGTGEDISIKNLAELIAEIVGFKGSILWDETKPDGTPRKLLDVSRINSIGWRSKISIKNGLEHTINCFKREIKDGILRKENYQ